MNTDESDAQRRPRIEDKLRICRRHGFFGQLRNADKSESEVALEKNGIAGWGLRKSDDDETRS